MADSYLVCNIFSVTDFLYIHENVSRALVPLLTGQLEVLVDDISIVLKATEVTLVGAI